MDGVSTTYNDFGYGDKDGYIDEATKTTRQVRSFHPLHRVWEDVRVKVILIVFVGLLYVDPFRTALPFWGHSESNSK